MSLFSKKSAPKEDVVKKSTGLSDNGKSLTGIVVSTKMKDTAVVRVNRFIKIPKYERFMKSSKKYKAHDVGNTKKQGETVTIIECAPISKDKHFRVI